MDGVPDVSNYPIAARQVFVYEFPIRQTGTYWYHSHSDFQEQNGLAGPFVIEEANGPGNIDHDAVS
jgi:FtsP/CotA-like multicopper oxidase with cupredoxin domain